MHRWPGALKEYWSQKHRTIPSYSPQIKEKVLFETAGDEALTLPAADTNTSEWLASVWKPKTSEKFLTKFFWEWRRSSKLKIILLKTASAVSFLLGESELRLTVQRCDQQPLETNEKALLGNSARSRLHHYKAASVPLFSSSMSGETELQTGLCNKQFKGKVYKNAILKDWEHGQFTLKLCNSCSAQGWQMLPPPLRYGEREIKCVSCFYCVMLLSNLWKISHIKRNLWGECEQAFWNRIIQKKCCRYFKIPWEVYNPHTARREKNHSW